MSPLRLTYLALAIIGALWPWPAGNGLAPGAMIATWNGTPASAALLTDLALTATAFSLWVIAETRVRRNWPALWAIPAAWLIGLSFGLPLYLFLRTRPIT